MSDRTLQPSVADREKAKAIQFLCMKSPEPRRDRDGYCGNYGTCTDMASCRQKIDATAQALAEADRAGYERAKDEPKPGSQEEMDRRMGVMNGKPMTLPVKPYDVWLGYCVKCGYHAMRHTKDNDVIVCPKERT